MPTMKKQRSKVYTILSCKSGAAAVEFAIVAPVFILLMMGMIAYGIYFGAAHSVQQLSADAARTAIAGLNAAERETLALRFIDLNAGGYAFIDSDAIEVTVNDNPDDAQQFVVSVSYNAENLPIWGLFTDLPLPGKVISRKSTIRIGGI